jgi:queuine tRNA-ribosyltransferase
MFDTPASKPDFGYALLGEDGLARLGEIRTPRGTIRTPAFMPVGRETRR